LPGQLIILDRDGVINQESPDYIRSPAEWVPLPGAIEAIADLTAHGYRIAVVSNQSGIGRGLFTESTLAAIHGKMRETVAAAGGAIAGIYYCPHRPDEGCDCRKPSPGLLRRIMADEARTLSAVPYIGDKRADIEAADAVAARPILVRTGYGKETERALAPRRVETYDDLAAAVRHLIQEA
jgi:D-glycero-D-manno-heptose 1,7-bisphosphate phosphatase